MVRTHLSLISQPEKTMQSYHCPHHFSTAANTRPTGQTTRNPLRPSSPQHAPHHALQARHRQTHHRPRTHQRPPRPPAHTPAALLPGFRIPPLHTRRRRQSLRQQAPPRRQTHPAAYAGGSREVEDPGPQPRRAPEEAARDGRRGAHCNRDR